MVLIALTTTDCHGFILNTAMFAEVSTVKLLLIESSICTGILGYRSKLAISTDSSCCCYAVAIKISFTIDKLH